MTMALRLGDLPTHDLGIAHSGSRGSTLLMKLSSILRNRLACSNCGLDIHWVSGFGTRPGQWAHQEPRGTARAPSKP
jgi:hypothetical protein